ncbi:DapH/DapD/GlmU-related protein [uncultured Nonlabens sp.]|jgi:acetyltransferase-like isoleucine patch superfamily enzyme|uniref:acyltransferase n=1 Tax=uncultured Nonlabens sp. TaxID=859306 RepID=UPI0030D9C8A1|tara:strand:- start:3641 stop:4174 length:534 start_codon:yes stop_codon:yes gene_type:complete
MINLFIFFNKARKKLLMIFLRKAFKKHGNNFVFDPYGNYSFNTIEVGDDVFFGLNSTILASKSGVYFGNKIMLGPNVSIIGGDHNTSIVGKYMIDVKDKLPENDLPIVIEDDVWVGCGVTILKGVRIGTGSIIAAGALIIKDVPKYSVVGGIPGRILKDRFNAEELIAHEKMINKKK